MSITENDLFLCDYCGEDFGEFDLETGNHPKCEELAALRERVKVLEALLEFAVNNKQNFTEHDSDGVINWWIEQARTALRGES